jgi:hypothetical protein
MGVSSDRVVAAVPTFAVQFRLRDVQQNLPGSNIVQGPNHISNEQVFSLTVTLVEFQRQNKNHVPKPMFSL